MNVRLKINDISSHFSQKSAKTTNETPQTSHSISQILSLRILNKFTPTKSTFKKPVFTSYLQKSPDVHFKPGEANPDSFSFPLKKPDQPQLAKATRTQGPARHRGSIKMKLEMINRSDNKSVTSDNNSINPMEIMRSSHNNDNNNSNFAKITRNRAKTSFAFENSQRNNTERLSVRKTKVVNRFYRDFVADVSERKETSGFSEEKSNLTERKTINRPLSSRMRFPKTQNLIKNSQFLLSPAPKLKEMDVGFNICQEMKSITSNHFFQKINEKKITESKNMPKRLKKAKSDVFYEDLMLSHLFETKLSDEERDRFSRFLMNDWVNRMIFERQINESGVMSSEFLDNSEEVEKIRKNITENKNIREKFQNGIQNINKAELFRPPNILNRFRESIYLSPSAQIQKTLKLSSLKEYLNSKHYLEKDQLYKASQQALKKLKVRFFKKKRRGHPKLEKERMWELRDSILEYCKMVKELGPFFTEDFLMNGLQRRPFENSGSYMFLSFVKKGKIAYLENLLAKDPKLIFDFDLVHNFLNFCLFLYFKDKNLVKNKKLMVFFLILNNFLKKWKIFIIFTIKLGKTGLHLACEHGYSDIVQLLLKHHARVNLRDIVGRTPLYFAAKNNDHTSVIVKI